MPETELILYDLCAADQDRRFSPYCWRTKLALKHKGLAFETIPVSFGTKELIDFSGHPTVLVLVDGSKTIVESFDIARYLDATYPERPTLFGDEKAVALARFVSTWSETSMVFAMLPLYVMDIYEHLAPEDLAYFRETREQRFGMTLEQFASDSVEKLARYRRVLQPLRALLSHQPFISGEAPAYADYCVFAFFASTRSITSCKFVEDADAVNHWRLRMFNLFDGYAADTTGYPV